MKFDDFSPLQKLAITLKDGNVLVSAGAGSGKTAVLIQRLYQIIKNQEATLDELLVLTFTNFAAKELKIRLRDILYEDEETRVLANQVEASDITTFDAFALKIFKKYSYILDLDPNIQIFDNALYAIKLREVIEEVLNEYYEAEDPRIVTFIQDYLKNNDQDLYTLIRDFAKKASLKIDSDYFVNTFVETYYSDTRFEVMMNEYERVIYDNIESIFGMIELIANDEVRAAYQEWTLIFSGASTYEDYCAIITNLPKPNTRKIPKEEYEDEVAYLEEIKKEMSGLSNFIEMGSREDIYKTFLREKEVAKFLVELYQKVDDRLNVFKAKHKIYTFSDVARFAYKIVTNPALNDIIATSYKYILLDEYQDTSDIQEVFIQQIARNNLYMVGDIKQSIYGFRNANPKIFQDKFEKYQLKEGGTLLNLVDNYRSRREIVEGVNAMLNVFMTPKFGGADYKKDHQIGFGNKGYDALAVKDQDYELEVLRYEPNSGLKKEVLEAYLIGTDIIQKIKQKYLVYDRKLKGHRPVTFGDFVILTRTKSILDAFIRVFNELQIPLLCVDKLDVKETRIVQTLLSGLKIFNAIKEAQFDNELRMSFASFARSFVIQMDDQMLHDYLLSEDKAYQTSQLYLTFKGLVEAYRYAPPSLILEKILEHFDIMQKLVSLGDVEANRATIFTMLEMVSNLESFDMDFASIINHFDLFYEQDEVIEIGASEGLDNIVRMMTIHASKGLEFPIVYFPYFSNGFNVNALYHKFKVSNDYGLILPYGKRGVAQSLAYRLNYHQKLIDLISEEIRLLYVALTRPQEKMLIVMPQNYKKKVVNRMIKCRSYIDLLTLTPYFTERIKDVTIDMDLRAPAITKADKTTFMLNELNLPKIALEQRRASKVIEVLSPELEDVLKLGVKYHKYLEIVDLYTKDLSFIEDEKDRQVIDNVLSLDLFHNLREAKIYQEYRFYDEKNEVEAVIDLFVIRNDSIELIDYKLSGIDDIAYEAQLDFYARYLLETFKLPVKIYLLSIFKKSYRLVKEFRKD